MTVSAITPYERRDRSAVTDLLFYTGYEQVHLDWHDTESWLEGETAVVRLGWRDDELVGVVAANAPVNGASWVRVVGVTGDGDPLDVLQALCEALWGALQMRGARMVCWLVLEQWCAAHLPALGFAYLDDIVTLRRTGYDLPSMARPPGLHLRTATHADIPAMTQVDHAAFIPPWQNSGEEVRQAYRIVASATVAEFDSTIIGYQMSTVYQQSGHLARLAVDPARHGRGIGGALLSDLITGLLRRGVRTLTVNTQATNARSLRLYQHYGFKRNGYDMPVWIRYF